MKKICGNFSAPRAVTESDQDDSGSESLDESEGEESLTGDDDSSRSSAANEDTMDQSDEDISSSQSGSEFSDSEAGSTSPTESTAEGDDITVMSLASLREDLEKGKAAQEQVCKLRKTSVHMTSLNKIPL